MEVPTPKQEAATLEVAVVHTFSPETVDGIEEGPATYAIGEDRLPAGYERQPVLDTDRDGVADTPLVVEDVGEFVPGWVASAPRTATRATHAMIYGAADVDGDGTGRLAFLQPTVGSRFLDGLDRDVTVEVGPAGADSDPGRYPTEYAVRPDQRGGASVAITGLAPRTGRGA